MSDDEKPTLAVFVCTTEDFHPYECGFEGCRHCERRKTEGHDPDTCALCNWENQP